MTVITVRMDEETKSRMDSVDVNWSEVIRTAIRKRVEEENRRNLAKAVLINEELRRPAGGEEKAEDIIMRFREPYRRCVKSVPEDAQSQPSWPSEGEFTYELSV